MNRGIEWVTHWFQEQTSIYIALLIWVLIYLLIDWVLTQLAKKQKDRKKIVMERLHELKEPYRQRQEIIEEKEASERKTIEFLSKYDNLSRDANKWKEKKEAIARFISRNRMVEALRFEKKLTQDEIIELQKESNRIIKEEKSKSSLPLLLFMFKLFIFIRLLTYFNTLEEIEYSLTLVFVTTIVSFFATLTRKTAGIFLALAVISLIVYQLFSGSALWFLLYYWFAKGVIFRIKRWKMKNER